MFKTIKLLRFVISCDIVNTILMYKSYVTFYVVKKLYMMDINGHAFNKCQIILMQTIYFVRGES